MRIAAYVVMLIALATLLPWLMMAPMSIMAFDSGPSAMAYGFVGGMFAYPIWLLGWLWFAWKGVRAGQDSTAILRAVIGAGPMLLILAAVFGPHRPH